MKSPSDRVELPSEELVLAAAPLEKPARVDSRQPNRGRAGWPLRNLLGGQASGRRRRRPNELQCCERAVLITSRPTPQGTGWTVVMVASPPQTWTQEVYVVCANVAP